MPVPIPVFEAPSELNFHREGYLLANPDLIAASEGGYAPEDHFRDYGRTEARRQVTKAFLDTRKGEYAQTKFAHFKDVIDWDQRAPSYLQEHGSFPAVLADKHFSREDYSVDSACQSYPPFVDHIISMPKGRFLDLGCGVREKVFSNCLYLDVYPSMTVDLIVGPECSYPIRSNSLDGIACIAVMEHTEFPWLVADEIHRMLKPGGTCYIDYPFLQPIHGYPSHYFNATREGLISLFQKKFEVESCVTGNWEGPDHTVTWILRELVSALSEEKRKQVLDMPLSQILKHDAGALFWEQLLKDLPDRVRSTLACGNMLTARKLPPPPPLPKVETVEERLTAELAAIRSSRSWRLTKPLRSLRRKAGI